LFVEVIIPLALPKNYTWSVPDTLQSQVAVGKRVEVLLGKTKRYAGIIKQILTKAPDSFIPKPILQVLDEEPILHAQQLAFWEWMAAYYICTEGEVMQAAVPANLKLSSEGILCWNEAAPSPDAGLSDLEYLLAEALEIKKTLKMSEVQELLDVTDVYRVIKKLIEKDYCFIWEELKQKYKPKTIQYLQLHATYQQEEAMEKLLNEWGSAAPKQMEMLLAFLHLQQTEGEVTRTALLEKSGASAAQLKALIDKGILQPERKITSRIATTPKKVQLPFTLTPVQQTAMSSIEAGFEKTPVCLLHGVTASGKTEIYTTLTIPVLQRGAQVLYMLPEIALTAQIIRRLQKSLGGYVWVYHSKFSANERVEIWNRVKSGEPIVVLGARSALLLPFKNLQLIICDEEHDASYKQQEPAPRYHARDAAIYLAHQSNAKVLLGSATPSMESYYNAQQHKYSLITLTERYNNWAMPAIEIIDHKTQAAHVSAQRIITPALQEQIQLALANKQQVILFQNRRGYSPYQICSTCGWIPTCNQCNVSLTYHKFKHQLSCHYCGTQYPVVQICAACGMHDFNKKNFGTEKVEELINELFPEARVARMDFDSVKGKYEHDTLIKLFEQHQIDILIGTQMVVKGLHFDEVCLVGIIDADGLMQFADFRVNERAFQLMEQVSGRAGRKEGGGKVLIQVHQLHHPIIGWVQAHDYTGFYDFEVEKRKQFGYPPFTRLIKLVCKHKEDAIAADAALALQQTLEKKVGCWISAPAQPPVNRVRNQYIWELLVKLPKASAQTQRVKQAIQESITAVQQSKSHFRSVRIFADVDPV
jgi:primosomal protein N' (replication factor Y) (superfamily II helicase)